MARDPRFEVNIGERPDEDPIADGGSFTIAIFGDFSARAHRGNGDTTPLGKRPARRVDRDDVDAAIAAFAPRLELAIEAGQAPIVLTFASLDDFHPDRIAERTPAFQQFRAMKRELSAAGPAPTPRAPSSEARTNRAALDLGSGSLLDQIVDSAGGAAPALRNVAPTDSLGDFVANAMAGHTVRSVNRDQQTLIDQIDAVISATMRVVLHHPEFQALESLWRSVDFLVRRLDGSEPRIALVDVTRQEFAGVAPAGIPSVSMAVAAFQFGTTEIASLARIAEAAARSGVPVVAGADASFAGASTFDNTDPDDWNTAIPAGWNELRASAAARFLSLALPRFMLRLPYGKATDACETMDFEEMPAPSHDAYLWSNAAFAVATVVAEGVVEGDEPPTQGVIDNLPLHVVRVNGEPTAKPAGEAWLAQRAVAQLLDRGLTPLETSRDGDSVRIPRIQSVAAPPQRLSFAES